ncbi:transcription factor S-II, central domain-containing protein [Gymnopilus junonius]|uniref:Transcription elongation factor n=1 Tax=Gymnopilus junonius TaxID=109634 RepID=A0A9P5NUJ2_GYMJU|nr:transcription factor S-II, central domain-containing protein [Gymnopilus junonius]
MMSDSVVVELKKTVKQLQSAVNEQEILSILNTLKPKHVTEIILRESKVGLAVGKLRTHASKPVSDLAKEIVKSWKTAVEKAKSKAGGSTASANGDTGKKPTPGASTPTTPSTNAAVRNSKTDNVKGKTGDNTRDKCVELIYDALACDATAPIELVAGKAHDIERCVWTNMGGTNTEYKSKIRSLFVNLKDKSNPGLRASIVDGSLTPEKFSRMTSQDMASEERKAADKKIKEENFFKSLSAAEKQAETDAFQCSRCKQRKCVYRQQQTRSADEPMTTFVTCTVCQNRWKFS